MYTIISLFFISLLLIVTMIFNKLRQIEKGKAFITLNGSFDNVLGAKVNFSKKMISEFPKHFGREAFYVFIHKSVAGLKHLKNIIYPKISHIVESVKGKDIPKERGNASFFLVHIREHKESMRQN